MSDIFKPTRRQTLLGAAAAFASTSLPASVMAQAPRKGGAFRLGIADFATADSLDPTLVETQFSQHLQWQLRNNLVEAGPGGKLIPELAESWEGSKDAVTWTFKLRKGVTFHNGKSLTAADVVHSYNVHRREGTKSQTRPILAQIKSIRADGSDTVVFELNSGNVGFPALTSSVGLVILPDGDMDFAKGMGTGGYILEQFEPGVRSRVRRNPNYWKAGKANFDTVDMICIKDATARANALITGQIDAYNAVDPRTVSLLERGGAIRINRVKSKAHFSFPMMVDQAPFTSNDVRLAMKYAIDREEIVKRVLGGFGTPGNDHPLSEAYEFYNGAIPQRAYDPEKAKFHLNKAGAANLKVNLHVSETPFTGATDAAVLFKGHAAKAGITIDVVKEPEDGYWAAVWNKKALCASRWSGRINEDVMFTLGYTDVGIRANWNETRINNERLNKLVADARTEFDVAKRREFYGEVQRIIHEEGGTNVFAFADFLDATSRKVAFGELAGDWMLDGCRASERWWFT